jgi:predicted RND superfamily exporter protein
VAAFSLLFALFIPRVRLRLDARSLIPAGHPDLAASDVAAAAFGLRDVIMIGITRKDSDIYNAATLDRIARLSEAIAHTDGVVTYSVKSIANTPRLLIKDNRLDVRPLLLTGSLYDAAAIRQIRDDVEALGLNDGVLVAKDGSAAVIMGEIRPDADRYLLLQHLDELTSRESQDGDSIYVSGTGPAQAVLGQASARDLMRLVPLVLVVLGLALTVGFRRSAPALISLVEIGVSLIWTVGLMGLTGQSVFVTTLVMPVVLIAVGVSDDVYVLKRYFEEACQSGNESFTGRVLRVFDSMIWPIGLTTISTTVGLFSMTATSLKPLQIFGGFAALAIVFSTLFTFSLVPALLVLMNPKVSPTPAGQEKIRIAITFFISRLVTVGPLRILVLLALAAISAVFLTTRLRIDDSWIKNLPPESEVARGDQVLNKMLAGTTTLDLVLDSGQPAGFLQSQSIQYILNLEDRLSALPFVGACYGISDDVVRLNAALHGANYAAYRAALARGEIRPKAGEIEQALMLLTVARRAPSGEWIDGEYRRARLTIFILTADYGRIAGVLHTAFAPTGAELPKMDFRLAPFGDGWISYTTVRLLVEGQVYSIALALCTDLLLLTLLLRSLRFSLMAMLPVGFSVLIVFAALALTGTPLGIANSMFVGIAIGVGLDFAIHLTAAYRRRLRDSQLPHEAMTGALMATGPAILTSAVSLALGFSVLTLSEIRPNVQLGLMICLSLTVCALATLVIIPSLELLHKRGKSP